MSTRQHVFDGTEPSRRIPAGHRAGFGAITEIWPDTVYWEQDKTLRLTAATGLPLVRAKLDSAHWLGKTVWELPVDPVNDGGWEAFRSQLAAHEHFRDVLFRFVTPAGETRFISACGQPRFGAGGAFRGYRGLCRDVTAQVRTDRCRRIEERVTKHLLRSTDQLDDRVFPEIIRAICEPLGWAGGVWWKLEGDSRTPEFGENWAEPTAASRACIDFIRNASPLPALAHGLYRFADVAGQAHWIGNVGAEASLIPMFASGDGPRSAILLPVATHGSCHRLLTCFSRAPESPDRELLGALGRVIKDLGEFVGRSEAQEDVRRFRAAMEVSGDQIFLVDRSTMRFVDVNQTAIDDTGYSREELLRMGPHELIKGTVEEIAKKYDEVIAAGSTGITQEIEGRDKQGGRSMVELHRRAMRSNGRWLIVTVSRNIAVRKRAEAAERRLRRMFATLSAVNDAILHVKSADVLYQQVCDVAVEGDELLTTTIFLADPQKESLRVVAAAGRHHEHLREMEFSDKGTPEGEGLVRIAFRTQSDAVSNHYLKDERLGLWRESAKRAGVASAAAIPLTRNNSIIGVLSFFSNERDAFDAEIPMHLRRLADNVVFALGNFEDAAQRRLADDRVQYLATHDSLTGLSNRTMFNELLNHTIASARRYQHKFALMFLDLDRFKGINDSLGHAAGDVLLIEIAQRLNGCLRSSDVVARLGGDEFVILVEQVGTHKQAAAIARKLLAAVVKPLNILGQACHVTTSIGIAMYPDDAEEEPLLMKHADTAMYYAKERGKNNFQFFSNELKVRSVERLSFENHLRTALQRNEFRLEYQPQLDLKTGSICGAEALLRWDSPELGLVPPAQFIPIAEEIGLIVAIGRWVLKTACTQARQWQRPGLERFLMAVNLSAVQFASSRILGDISLILSETGLRPELLELEITEGMLIQNPTQALARLVAIKSIGVRFAIDDFGTGYSSFGQIKNFPVDTLKIDRCFIQDLPGHRDKAIVDAMINAHALNLKVVAEGVESLEQAEYLRDHACDEAQGYYFSRPVRPEQFSNLLCDIQSTTVARS